LSLFRRKESLHEKLAREGGLVETETTAAPWDKAGIHGVARPRRWDAVVTAEAELDGDSAARLLGISRTACSTRLSRALRRLEERMNDVGE